MAKILIVDDEELNLKLIEGILKDTGYELYFAKDGKEALEKTYELMPDLILLDIMMPEVDGYKVARKLKQDEETRIIPIIMITALKDLESKVKAINAGADDFISKPVDPNEVQARVKSLLKVKKYNDLKRNYQAELEDTVRKRTEELKKAHSQLREQVLDTIYRLSRAAEYRDEQTGAHIKRMSHYSAIISKELGLSKKTVEMILLASPMHDVGKIGIPDHILLKPGKLEPNEWEIMKQHTTIGASILSGARSGYLKLSEIIALTHHEWWDGSGYPRGLKGNQIPLVGQIVAVADVFDALTSKRPYKEAFSVEKSLAIVREETGTHLSPKVVDAFFRVLPKILEIKERFKDEEESLLFRMVKGSGG